MAIMYGKSPTGINRRLQVTPYGDNVRVWIDDTSIIVSTEEFIREVGFELERLLPQSDSQVQALKDALRKVAQTRLATPS